MQKLTITFDIPDEDSSRDPFELAWMICERVNDASDFAADVDPTDASWECS